MHIRRALPVRGPKLARRGLLLAPLAGCAPRLEQHVTGTPAAAFLAGGFASLHAGGEAPGRILGAVVGLDDGHVLTCAHVMPRATRAWLRRPDGRFAAARVAGRSPDLDVLVLRVEPGFLRPAAFADRLPVLGEAVWALGAPGIGPAMAAGQVDTTAAVLEGSGPGFIARMPALMGYSGGPVIVADGSVLGMTAALLRPGAAGLVAMLVGMDLDGMSRGEGRQVFALSATPLQAEARRLLAG
ncbi:trypsin-like peptidase domain-containing protein [Humitalea sp. 24SJ18S-53]|uniref:trypsin-like peptidase domain-containing protein n=1 Tax=Humitalea sp. 24SJ18S-53 TaxID=3422307 RepID=UPI003D664283